MMSEVEIANPEEIIEDIVTDEIKIMSEVVITNPGEILDDLDASPTVIDIPPSPIVEDRTKKRVTFQLEGSELGSQPHDIPQPTSDVDDSSGTPQDVEEHNEKNTIYNIPIRRINLIGLGSQPLLLCPVEVKQFNSQALIDNGAGMSLIQESLAMELNLKLDTSEKIYISGLGSNVITTQGFIVIKLNLHGFMSKSHIFHVVEDMFLEYPILVGRDFLIKNELLINPSKRRISYIDNTDARWDLYLGDQHSNAKCLSIISGVPCTVKKNTNLEEKTTLVPVSWEMPRINMQYKCSLCMDELSNFYDGEMKYPLISAYSGICGPAYESAVLINTEEKNQILQSGDIIGRIYSLVEVDQKEVNVCFAEQELNGDNRNIWTREKIKEEILLGDNVSEEQKKKIHEVLYNRREVLSSGDTDIGKVIVGKHHIDLYDYTPIFQRPRRLPAPMADEIEKQCKELQAVDVIEPSISPWSAPVVPVRKPDNSIRMCIDYRKLNKVTIPDRFPMPNINDAVYGLHGIKYLTSLDLVRGYYQVPVDKESRELTAFSTCRGHWQFKRMPFGLCNAPATFQRQIQEILRDFPRDQVIIYIDDILIIGTTFEQHLYLVDRVLSTLDKHGIKIKPSKCLWFKEKLKFLGHMISCKGVSKDPEYIKKVLAFPKPQTVKQLKEFLGLINFQRKFVPHCAEIGQPLYSQTGLPKKTILKWTPRMEESFEKIKEIMARDISLAFPNYSPNAAPLELYVDASLTGIGVCLGQQQENEFKIIAYSSINFNRDQQGYSTIEKELAAIRFGVKTFRGFLLGQFFILYTDHQPLIYLHNMRIVDARLARTLEDLANYNFEIRYVPGKKNVAADTMSRFIHLNNENDNQKVLNGVLPEGLYVIDQIPGGGDSLFHSLVVSYKRLLQNRNPEEHISKVTEDHKQLREILVNELLKHPAKYGLEKGKDITKHLKLMKYPGQLPIPDVLLVFANLYKAEVYLHYGGDRPIIYRVEDSIPGKRVHLQCLAGIHYNPVGETFSYGYNEQDCVPKTHLTSEPEVHAQHLEYEVSTINEVDDIQYAEPFKEPMCNHNMEGNVISILLNDTYYCSLLDFGAQVNLMAHSVYLASDLGEIENADEVFLKGIAMGRSSVIGAIKTSITFENLNITVDNIPFAIVEDDALNHCILLGLNFMNKIDLEFDYKKNIYKFGDILVPMEYTENLGISCLFNHVFVIELPLEKLMEGIIADQYKSTQLRQIRSYLERDIPKTELPRNLTHYRREWNNIDIKDELLVRKNDDKYIPLVSFEFLIGVVLNIHIEMAHIGMLKLFTCLEDKLWHPSLRKVIKDACSTCGVCQKIKTTGRVIIPPTLKIETNRPFELMAIDLVSLPRTKEGYIGILVMVDHFTKWLTVFPIKNKQARSIVNVLEYNIFPTLLRLPERLLSDNGSEFVNFEVADLLERLNIHHIRTTAYKPSSNGAVERVNRTIIGFLRALSNHPSDWAEYLPRAIRIYNETVHRETGMSPANIIMTKEYNVSNTPVVSPNTHEVWSQGHPRYSSFRIGQAVLRLINKPGNLNIYKLSSKFEGPFKVIKINRNDVTYELWDSNQDLIIKAHHSQLKPWKEPPKYILRHIQKFPLTSINLENANDEPLKEIPYKLSSVALSILGTKPDSDIDEVQIHSSHLELSSASEPNSDYDSDSVPISESLSASDDSDSDAGYLFSRKFAMKEKILPLRFFESNMNKPNLNNMRVEVLIPDLESVNIEATSNPEMTFKDNQNILDQSIEYGTVITQCGRFWDEIKPLESDTHVTPYPMRESDSFELYNFDFYRRPLKIPKNYLLHTLSSRNNPEIISDVVDKNITMKESNDVESPNDKMQEDSESSIDYAAWLDELLAPRENIPSSPENMGKRRSLDESVLSLNDTVTGRVVLPVEPGFWWSVSSISVEDTNKEISREVIDNQELPCEADVGRDSTSSKSELPCDTDVGRNSTTSSYDNDSNERVEQVEITKEDKIPMSAEAAEKSLFKSCSNSFPGLTPEIGTASCLFKSYSNSFSGFTPEEGSASQLEENKEPLENNPEGKTEESKEECRKRTQLDRLNRIRQEVNELRESIEENRRASLSRFNGIVNVRNEEDRSSREVTVRSPPFTRSRGRAMDLPHVSKKILERKQK